MDYSWNIKANLGISMAYFKDINDTVITFKYVVAGPGQSGSEVV